MNSSELDRFFSLYEEMIRAMKLHGLRIRTIESYCSSMRRVAHYFDRCPDELTPTELKDFFSSMLEHYSWSTIKVTLSALQFFHRYVLDREMQWVKIVRPPRICRIPDIPTREEVRQVINSVRKLRYRVFLLFVYSLGLRITEGLAVEVNDIHYDQKRVLIRDGKGGVDRYVPLPEMTYRVLRRFWPTHRHPRLLFPSPQGSRFQSPLPASKPMDGSGVQAAFKASKLECGIEKRITVHSLRHAYTTHLMELGMEMRLVQGSLGHKSISTTARYAHITQVLREQNTDRTESLLDGFELRWEEVS
ncbi:MAG: tyrosine-type recombinase/integrase [Cyanobacteriota bacterium]